MKTSTEYIHDADPIPKILRNKENTESEVETQMVKQEVKTSLTAMNRAQKRIQTRNEDSILDLIKVSSVNIVCIPLQIPQLRRPGYEDLH